jgi:hypothetical protein
MIWRAGITEGIREEKKIETSRKESFFARGKPGLRQAEINKCLKARRSLKILGKGKTRKETQE